MKTFIQILFSYIGMMCLFTFLIIVAYSIPQSRIQSNIIKSEQLIQKEGLYPQIFSSTFFMLDNYTDALMFNISASADMNSIVQSAIENPYFTSNEGVAVAGEQIAKNRIKGLSVDYYGRYWQGYQVFLRPVLIFMDYAGIRIMNYILLTMLTVWCCVLMWKKFSYKIALIFLISLLFINFPIVPLSMQFSTCFYISFLSMIMLFKIPYLTKYFSHAATTFFIIGGVTAFLDFLTTPQLTLGFPLIIYMFIKEQKKSRNVVLLSFFWALGYGGIWASKWCLGTIITKRNFFIEALNQIQYRSIGEFEVNKNSFLLEYKYFLLILVIILLLLLVLLYKKAGRGLKIYKSYMYLLLISLIVPVWFFIIKNHSIEHLWFTWRALSLTLFSSLLYIYHTIDLKKINIRL